MGDSRNKVEHILDHAASIAVGVVLIIVGLVMTYTLVLGVPGAIVLVIGVALVIAGFVRHSARRARLKS